MFQANPVIKTIIWTNIAIYMFATAALGAETVDSLRFVPAEASIESVFANIFLHAGLMHLGFNMMFLHILDDVEEELGKLWFIVTYFASGLASTGFHYLSAMDSTVPLVGASGAICGILGAACILSPRIKVGTINPKVWEWFQGGKFLINPTVVTFTKWFGLINVVAGIVTVAIPGNGGGVAWWAHVGGLVMGYSIAYYFNKMYPDVPDEPIKENLTLRSAWGIKK